MAPPSPPPSEAGARRFAGRTAIVTGAGGGAGLAIATGLAAEGAAVVAVDLKERPAELPEACAYVRGDVTDPALPKQAVQRAIELGGGLDHLVNGAGVAFFGRDGSVAEMADELWEQVLAINLTAAMRFARACTPALRERRGAMVHIASVAGLRGMDDPMDAYQVSKAGLISLSRGLAMALAPDGVRSNTICPGAIDTPMVASIYADLGRRERMAARTPLRRLGTPDDVAQACLYLLSDAASFVTGTDLVVDGGWLAVLP
jgi:NAD(P)-dependent dehydrogenase (short-subunit alcohol dehydrogenase family)